MYKLEIITVKKTKEKWLQLALEEYEKRLSSHFSIQWMICRDNKQLLAYPLPSFYIVLAPGGNAFSSENFSKKLFELLEKKKAPLTFIIGGPEGIPKEIEKNSSYSLSLSSLTFTHQMARLFLLEQIYRSWQISIGSNYHK